MSEADKLLSPFFPENAYPVISEWIRKYPIHITITNNRITKFGDYRPPFGRVKHHKISINKNLNPYAFLITFTHEYAHLLCYQQFGKDILPHGVQWKNIYKSLLFTLLEHNIFPKPLQYQLARMISGNVASSSAAEKDLQKCLSLYDVEKENHIFLEALPQNSLFVVPGGRIFRKGEKQKTRYKCLCINNKRWYYVSAVAKVSPMSGSQ